VRYCIVLRVMTVLCMAGLFWHVGSARAQTTSPEALLDAYYDLWHQLGRQPTSEEVESQSSYTPDEYMETWQSQESLRRALIDHLYQRALEAALRRDAEAAAGYYEKCLEIDPDHAQSRAAYRVDLDEASGMSEAFTEEKAGSVAATYFLTFLAAREQGDEQAAREYFMLAQSRKAAFIASEVEGFRDTYNTAVNLFNQGSYAEAIVQFQVLIEIRPNQVGYESFYIPNANSIRQYLADAIYLNATERAGRFRSRAERTRFTIWYTGNWMANFDEFGLEATRLSTIGADRTPVPLPNFKMATRSYLGGDLGASVRITGPFSVGLGWSQLMLSPHADVTVDGFNSVEKIQGGSLSAISGFVELSTMISRTTQAYLQAGAGRYNASFPNIILGTFERPPRLLPHESAAIGGFLGGGLNAWFVANDFGLLGVRLDLKYHRMNGNDLDSERSILLNGVRFGAGLSFSK